MTDQTNADVQSAQIINIDVNKPLPPELLARFRALPVKHQICVIVASAFFNTRPERLLPAPMPTDVRAHILEEEENLVLALHGAVHTCYNEAFNYVSMIIDKLYPEEAEQTEPKTDVTSESANTGIW
jgi:hypothetical protein